MKPSSSLAGGGGRSSRRTCKPNSVPGRNQGTAIPLGPALLPGSSDLPGSFTGRAGPRPSRKAGRNSSPIWSCSVWGLPCPGHCCPGGALLPHLFTLTPTNRGGMFSVALSVGRIERTPGQRPGATHSNPPSRTLSGTLLCGVRTFLPRIACAIRQRPSGPPATPSL